MLQTGSYVVVLLNIANTLPWDSSRGVVPANDVIHYLLLNKPWALGDTDAVPLA